MGLKRVMWVRRYQGQCRALRPLGHQGYRLRNHKKDQPLCSGYTLPPVTPADLLLINNCISQNPGSKCKNIENTILLQP